MVRRLTLIASVLAISSLLLGAVSGCRRGQGQGSAFSMPPPPVTTAPVEVADVPLYLDEIGRAAATEVVSIVPQVSGKIISRDFQDGTELHVGEKLFQIDPRPFQAVLDQADALLEQFQAQLANAKTNFDRVASELPSKAVSQQDYDNAKDTVAVADANVKSAQAQIETAKLNLEYCTIKSPIDGRAGARLVDVGNVVNANSTSLLTIEKTSPIYVNLTVPENDLDRVRQSLARGPIKVEVESPADPTQTIDGTVDFLDNAVQDGTGTVRLRANLANKGQQLWPGQFVHIKLILEILHNALLIPSEAVQIGQQGQFVYTVISGKMGDIAQRNAVTTGQQHGGKVVVLSGLAGGETVIRSGQLMVLPGLPVAVQPAGGAAGGAGQGGAGASAGASGSAS